MSTSTSTSTSSTTIGEKLTSNEVIFKRLLEQLKFDRVPQEEWYENKYPASFCFSINETNYSIYYNDDGKYVIISNFNGGCSLSKQTSKPMDLDDVFTKFDTKFDKIIRSSMSLRNSERIYSYLELVAMAKIIQDFLKRRN